MVDIAKIRTKDITSGLTVRLMMPRTLSLRMKLGSWLIRAAGWVMHMPCEVELVERDGLRPGDVVHDLRAALPEARAAKVMTVHSIGGEGFGRFATCVWFEGDELRSARIRPVSLAKVKA